MIIIKHLSYFIFLHKYRNVLQAALKNQFSNLQFAYYNSPMHSTGDGHKSDIEQISNGPD